MQVQNRLGGQDHTAPDFDIVFVANVTRKGDVGLRIRHEIEICFGMGLRVGIRHLPEAGYRSSVSPDIHYCVTSKMAEIILPTQRTNTKLALVFSPGTLKSPATSYGNLTADRTVLVIDRMPSTSQMGLWHSFSQGDVSWAPTNRWIRSALTDLKMPVRLEDSDWRPIARALPTEHRARLSDAPVAVGRLSLPGGAQWPADKDNMATTYGLNSNFDFLYVGEPPGKLSTSLRNRPNWTRIEFGDISAQRFLQLLDVFAYFPSDEVPEMPDAAIATAMASRKIVVLPSRFKQHFGPGAFYTYSSTFKSDLRELFDDEEALASQREAAVFHAMLQFSQDAYCERIQSLLSTTGYEKKRKKTVAPNSSEHRVLFVPSNGIGLGHVTRLLAIARRVDKNIQPVFATMAQGANVIEASGFTAEYIPSQSDTGAKQSDWDGWFRYQLGKLIDLYEARAVVFDGNNPTPSLVGAALSKGDCKLVWMRRGMLGATQSPFLNNARFMDLIIEPGEIARDRDSGVTASRREETLEVGPVTLLDRNEVMPRDAARQELGLSLDGPAVLVQLGAGANRDNLALIEQIVNRLKGFENLQIVLAEWENGLVRIPVFPSTRVLQAYPISKFFHAFDFSIAAAGYNTYHEVITNGLPTIFVANRHPQLDDQWSRAQFAQDNIAGFNLPEDELLHLPALCNALMDRKIRDLMSQNCLALADEKGAQSAATAISQLVSAP